MCMKRGNEKTVNTAGQGVEKLKPQNETGTYLLLILKVLEPIEATIIIAFIKVGQTKCFNFLCLIKAYRFWIILPLNTIMHDLNMYNGASLGVTGLSHGQMHQQQHQQNHGIHHNGQQHEQSQDLVESHHQQQMSSFPNLENMLPGGLTQEQALAFQQFQSMHGVMPVLSGGFPRPTVNRRKAVKWEVWEEKNLIEGVGKVRNFRLFPCLILIVCSLGVVIGRRFLLHLNLIHVAPVVI